MSRIRTCRTSASGQIRRQLAVVEQVSVSSDVSSVHQCRVSWVSAECRLSDGIGFSVSCQICRQFDNLEEACVRADVLSVHCCRVVWVSLSDGVGFYVWTQICRQFGAAEKVWVSADISPFAGVESSGQHRMPPFYS